MNNGTKISELPLLSTLSDNDILAGVDTSENVTSKVELATLKNYIDTNTQYTAGTNIDITNNIVSAPNVYNKTETDKTIKKLQDELDAVSTIYNAFPTTSDEGESMTLNDTAEVTFKKLDLKGNTSQASTPTPSSPIPVNVVSGDNEINICGKNLFDGTQVTTTNPLNWGVTFENNVLTLEHKTAYSSGAPNIVLGTLPSGNYTVSYTSTNRMSLYIDGVYDQLLDNGETFTAESGKTYAFYFSVADNSTVTFTNIMLVKGTTPATYEPYIGNTYPIYLGDIELCKIGTYQDYIYKDNGSWYLHKEIGKVVLDGSESWIYNSTNQVFYITTLANYGTSNNIPYSNYYKGATNVANASQAGAYDNNTICFLNDNVSNLRFYIKDTRYATPNDLKTWLSNNNTIVYYVLATPTNTLIEDTTLIEQLEELKLATSYATQTNISQENNDLAFIINAEAIMSLKNIFSE